MNIYIMCGLIGSGKSYRAKQIRKDRSKGDDRCIIINRDTIRTMMFGGYKFDSDYESLVKDYVRRMMGGCYEMDVDYIIDETMLTADKRSKMVALANAYQNNPVITIVYCSEQIDNLKNRMREPKGVSETQWNTVLAGMRKVFEPVTEAECKELGVKFMQSTMPVQNPKKSNKKVTRL